MKQVAFPCRTADVPSNLRGSWTHPPKQVRAFRAGIWRKFALDLGRHCAQPKFSNFWRMTLVQSLRPHIQITSHDLASMRWQSVLDAVDFCVLPPTKIDFCAAPAFALHIAPTTPLRTCVGEQSSTSSKVRRVRRFRARTRCCIRTYSSDRWEKLVFNTSDITGQHRIFHVGLGPVSSHVPGPGLRGSATPRSPET